MPIVFSRVSSIYLITLIAFAGGMTVLLDWGSVYLTAPADLRGRWQVVDGHAGDAAAGFSVQQSGKFIQLALDGGPRLDLILTKTAAGGGGLPPGETLTFDGDGWEVLATGSADGGLLTFTFRPPASAGQPWSGVFQCDRAASQGRSRPAAKSTAAAASVSTHVGT